MLAQAVMIDGTPQRLPVQPLTRAGSPARPRRDGRARPAIRAIEDSRPPPDARAPARRCPYALSAGSARQRSDLATGSKPAEASGHSNWCSVARRSLSIHRRVKIGSSWNDRCASATATRTRLTPPKLAQPMGSRLQQVRFARLGRFEVASFVRRRRTRGKTWRTISDPKRCRRQTVLVTATKPSAFGPLPLGKDADLGVAPSNSL